MNTLRTVPVVVILCAAFLGAYGTGAGATETSPGRNVTASYTPGAKAVDISIDGKIFHEVLRGYQATDLLVDRNGPGGMSVLFLDDQGMSVGGDLRAFMVSDDHPSEINNDYSGHRISLEKLAGAEYIVLWQHDTKDFYYASELLQVNGGQLHASVQQEPWLALIHDKYQPKIKEKTDNYSLSRYDYYIGAIYAKLGDKTSARTYLTQAGKLDPGNRQIAHALERLSSGNKH